MNELANLMAVAHEHLTEEWRGPRIERALTRIRHARRRRRIARTALVIGLAGLGLAISISIRAPGTSARRPAPEVVAARVDPDPLAERRGPAAAAAPMPSEPGAVETVLADGSRLVSEADNTLIDVEENHPTRVGLVLRRGRARLEASGSRDGAVVFKIESFVVRVSGAVTVERTEERVGIWVRGGEVQVSWPGGDEVLRPGESRWYGSGAVDSKPLPGRTPSVRRGKPRRAPDELLREMDLARSGGRIERAVLLLETFLRRHDSDPRAPSVAFTLGRLRLSRLHRPREAARAFARARALAPSGILAEDALAREVEAWSAAGEIARARSRARDYLRRYPEGRRAAAVRRCTHADLE
jgi:hypothetical protein